MRAVERSDQRLDHAERAVECARIAPGFEVMRFGDVPVAKFGSFIEMRAEVDGVLTFFCLVFSSNLNFGGEIEIVRRGVDGIDAEDQQRVHFAGVNIGAKTAQGFEVIHGVRFH